MSIRRSPSRATANWSNELEPRLESAADVLFARAPTLPAGDYKLHWAVRTMAGVDTIQGDIPFTVKDQP